jgi:hypothetical protein
MPELYSLVESIGGAEPLAQYLDVSPELIESALAAPRGAWTDRVCRMVCENTGKLLAMPSQGGLFWRLTRRRVVKDWVLLARWGEARSTLGQSSDVARGESPTITNEQRETFDYALAEASVLSDEQHGEPSIGFDGDLFVVAIPLLVEGREAVLRYEIRPDGSFRTSHSGASPSDWLPPRSAFEYLLDHFDEQSDS